ncbi:MAG: DMT family transporter [Thermoanaerobaculales bacterium]
MSRTLAVLMLAAAGCTWGATFPVVKAALADTGPLTFLALRFGLASVLLVPLLRFGGGVGASAWRAVLCGVALFLGYALQTTGLATTTPARSAFITALSVVLVPTLEPVFGIGRATMRVWCGACLALAGLAVLLRPDAGPFSVGDLLTVGCAAVFGLHVLLLQWTVRAVPATRASTIQVLTTAALAVPFAGIEGWKAAPTIRLAAAVLVCALLATVGAFWVMTTVQRVLSASMTAVVLTLEPVAAAVTSVAMGQDTPSIAMILGGIIVIAGVILATATPRRSPH